MAFTVLLKKVRSGGQSLEVEERFPAETLNNYEEWMRKRSNNSVNLAIGSQVITDQLRGVWVGSPGPASPSTFIQKPTSSGNIPSGINTQPSRVFK